MFLGLIVASIFVARSTVTQARDSMGRQLGVAAAASVAAGSTCFAFFDALSFPMSAAFLFLMMGTAGALARLPMEPLAAASPRPAFHDVRV
jgi:hypothetical protein